MRWGAKCEHAAAGFFALLGLSIMISLLHADGEMDLDRAINGIGFG